MAYWLTLVDAVLLAAILALSLNLLLGFVGQLTVAHAAFAGIGAYSATLVSMHWNWPFVASLLAAMVVAAGIGVIFSLPGLRLQDENLILLTLAVQMIFISVATSVSGLGGAYGLSGIHPVSIGGEVLLDSASWFPWLLGVVALVTLLLWRVTSSPYGRTLLAVQSDQIAAGAVGISVSRAKATAITIACAVAGLGGALYAYFDGVAAPLAWGFDRSLMILVMVIVGGRARLLGSVLGAGLVTALPVLLERYTPVAPERISLITGATFGAALVLMITLRPSGIIPRRRASVLRERRWRQQRTSEDLQYAKLSSRPAPIPTPPQTTPVMSAQGLTKKFGSVTAVVGFDLKLWPGHTTALIGPNGAGKTTAFNLLCGYTPPDRGQVQLMGRDITGWAPHRVARAGMVRSFQGVRLFGDLSVLDNVAVAVGGHPGRQITRSFFLPRTVSRFDVSARSNARMILKSVGLESLAEESVDQLSYAQQKLVSLARALASDASVLLLDEPLSGVDGKWVDIALDVIDQLKSEGRSVCIVEHSLLVVERLADEACFMELGSVTASGTVQDLFSQRRLVDAYFGGA